MKWLLEQKKSKIQFSLIKTILGKKIETKLLTGIQSKTIKPVWSHPRNKLPDEVMESNKIGKRKKGRLRKTTNNRSRNKQGLNAK